MRPVRPPGDLREDSPVSDLIFPDFPRFDIPESCKRTRREMTLTEYHEWVMDNVRDLQKKGLYEKYRKLMRPRMVDARFRLVEEPQSEM